MSDARLGILHITDLHAGQPEHDSYFPTIRAAFLRDLELCHHKSGPWDLVIFSGDLAFSGEERQYQQVEKFISELQKTIRSIDQSDPIFLAVPGNHDLERQDETNAVADVLANLTKRPKEDANKFWAEIIDNPKSDYQRLITKMFAAYTKWWTPYAEKARKRLEFRNGVLPGEFAAVLKKSGCQFAIIGLNTTFLQVKKGNFDGRLAVHPLQLNKLAPTPDEYGWLQHVDGAVLVTHQPPSWLSGANRREVFEPLIDEPGRFVFHLCGHVHIGEGRSERIGGAMARNLWLARALEAFDLTEDKTERTFGYQALAVTVDPASAQGQFRVWPRRAEKTQANQWRFSADASYELEDDGVPAISFRRPNAKSIASAGSAKPAPSSAARSPTPDRLVTENLKYEIRVALGNDPFLGGPSERAGVLLRDLFITPPLGRERDQGFSVRESTGAGPQELVFSIPKPIAFEELLKSRENYLITAPKQSGKTTLARLLTHDLMDQSDFDQITFAIYLDYLTEPMDNVYNLLRRRLYPSMSNVPETAISNHQGLTIIFDNFSFSEGKKLDSLHGFIEQNPQIRYIFLAAEAGLDRLGILPEPKLPIPIKRLYIHNWTSKEVRALLAVRYNVRRQRVAPIVTKVVETLVQMAVEASPPNVVLIVRLLVDQPALNVHNLADLVKQFIASIRNDQHNMSQDFKRVTHFLSVFADNIARSHTESITLPRYEGLISSYLQHHGLGEAITTFCQKVKSTGLVVELDASASKTIEFKHDCVRQFYGGIRMLQDRSFYQFCSSEEEFLRFSNELLVAAGESGNDEALLTLVKDRVVSYRDALTLSDISRDEEIVLSDKSESFPVIRLATQLDALRFSGKEMEHVVRSNSLDSDNEKNSNVNVFNGIEGEGNPDNEDHATRQHLRRQASKYIETFRLLPRLLHVTEMAQLELKKAVFKLILEELARLILYLIVLIDRNREGEGAPSGEAINEIGLDRKLESIAPERSRANSNQGDKLRSSLKVFIPFLGIGMAEVGCLSFSRPTFDAILADTASPFAKLICLAMAAVRWPDVYLGQACTAASGWKSAVLARRILFMYLLLRFSAKKLDLRAQNKLIDALLQVDEVDHPELTSQRKGDRDKWRDQRRVKIKSDLLKLATTEW